MNSVCDYLVLRYRMYQNTPLKLMPQAIGLHGYIYTCLTLRNHFANLSLNPVETVNHIKHIYTQLENILKTSTYPGKPHEKPGLMENSISMSFIIINPMKEFLNKR